MTEKISLGELLIPLHTIQLCGNLLRGKTRLQKLVFLSQEEFKGNFDYDFQPAQFGPLSYKLNHGIGRLKQLGLIKEKIGSTVSGNTIYEYSVTKEGKNFLEFNLQNNILDSKTINSNRKAVEQYNSMYYGELLDYVHEKYPLYLDA